MIGAKGSSENLDKSDELNPVTPCISKSAKKRKVTESSAFSAKKKYVHTTGRVPLSIS